MKTHLTYLSILALVAITAAGFAVKVVDAADRKVEVQKEYTFNVCVGTGVYNTPPEDWGDCADVEAHRN